MHRFIIATIIALTLALPASVAAWTPAEVGVFTALCRVYPTTPPASMNMSPAQWQSFCLQFS